MRRAFRAIVFDLDGTLTAPGAIDFARLRARLRAPAGVDVLTHAGADPELLAIIAEEEELGLQRARLNAGAPELLAFLQQQRAPRLFTGILTRNNDAVLRRTLAALPPLAAHAFDAALSRDWPGGPPKPHPAALLHMAREWRVETSQCIMVGDWVDDIAAGKGAGFHTVAIGTDAATRGMADAAIDSLAELIPMLQEA